jgi:hypothetical protein
MLTKLGAEIDTTCAVFIEYEQNDRGNLWVPALGADDWGDRAVVVNSEVCADDDHCHVLTVAPDEDGTLVYVHADDLTEYAVDTDTVAENV